MKSHPILFSGPMVRALLSGTKTQTRRVVKPQPAPNNPHDGGTVWVHKDGLHVPVGSVGHLTVREKQGLSCPYGQPGDRLWVRETFKAIASGEVKNSYGEVRYGFAYQADGATSWNERPTIIHDLTGQPPTGALQFRPVPWKPSIHMPHRASRITLEVTSVRVERLQDMHEDDAVAEGTPGGHGAIPNYPYHATSWEHYRWLWESINGPGSWSENPWVWVVEFKVLKA